MTVMRIAGWYKLGYSAEQIKEQIEHLSLAQVYAALAGYHANREEIDSDLDAEDAAYEALAREHSRLHRRIGEQEPPLHWIKTR